MQPSSESVPPIDPIWRIGLYERHVFRSNGRVGALCLECGEMFWENGTDEKERMGRALKRHLLTTHRQYGLKLLEQMLEEEEREEAEGRDGGGQIAKDANSTVYGTVHSQFVEAFHQTIVATETMPTELIEEKSRLKRKDVPNLEDLSNEINARDEELAKSLPAAQTDGDGTSTSTECDVNTSITMPSISADLWAAAQQLSTSLHNNNKTFAVADGKMPNLDVNLPALPPIVSGQFVIELPELPERVFPIYVDEHSVPWHWLHAAKNENQATDGYEKRLVGNESEERLFFYCATDKLCPFRAVWVRERSAVYQSRSHAHSPLLSPQRLTVENAPITPDRSRPLPSTIGNCPITPDRSCPLLSPQRSIDDSSQITDQSCHSQLPISTLIGKACPIIINVSGPVSSVSSGPISVDTSSQKSTKEWHFLAHVDENESNLGSICLQWSITRQTIKNCKDGTIQYNYVCKRYQPPFRCRFRAVFVRGQNSIFYRSAHNHSVPLSELEKDWLKEWKEQRNMTKMKQQRQPKVSTSELSFSSPLKSIRQFIFISDQQQSLTDSQQKSFENNQQIVGLNHSLIDSLQNFVETNSINEEQQQQQNQQQSSSQNANSLPTTECSPIGALQKFITYLDSRPSTSQQQQQQNNGGLINPTNLIGLHLFPQLNACAGQQQSKSAENRNGNGTMTIKQEHFDQ
ncbi:hypothetical protein niasHT_005374 [Heterodera trifolii]|uniref:FLYWCH-type domain-containing protein n=1 Tax=Heterodera trifolii TaxID=157864 RepID=A0ABD2M0X8_9BILA